MPIAIHIRPRSLACEPCRKRERCATNLNSPPCTSPRTTVSAARPLWRLGRRVSRADRPIQSARPDQRVASASRRAFPSPTAPRLKAGVSHSRFGATSSHRPIEGKADAVILTASGAVQGAEACTPPSDQGTASDERRPTSTACGRGGVTGRRDGQPNYAGYRMVRPEGFLDPEANVVRYHARRQFTHPLSAVSA